MKPFQKKILTISGAVAVICAILALILHLVAPVGSNNDQMKTTQSTHASSEKTSAQKQVSTATKNKKIRATKKKTLTRELQQYFDDQTKDGNLSIAFESLSPLTAAATSAQSTNPLNKDKSVVVTSRATELMPAASLSKLYLAAYLDDLIVNKKFDWNAENTAGYQKMLRSSDNAFADKLLEQYKNGEIDQYLKNFDIATTYDKKQDETQVLATDLLKVLRLIANSQGPYQNAERRAEILNNLTNQEIKAGIEQGVKKITPAAKIYDKTGFLNETSNDAGIVELPDGTRYMLVILTDKVKNQDFTKVAEIAEHVQSLVVEATK